MKGLLLDTCAVIWTGLDQRISARARTGLAEWLPRDGVFVSPFTAWEMSLLAARGRLNLGLTVEAWFSAYMRDSGAALAPLPVSVLVAAHTLPGAPPNDPADRILISTAREFRHAIVTRDRRILDYGDAGLVQTVPC